MSIFDLGNKPPDQDFNNKYARLKQITDMWREHPGRAPGGTGSTGLQKWDAQGWSNAMNEQTEALNIQREFQGKGPMQVRQAPMREFHIPGMAPGLESSPQWQADSVNSGPYGQATGVQHLKNEDGTDDPRFGVIGRRPSMQALKRLK